MIDQLRGKIRGPDRPWPSALMNQRTGDDLPHPIAEKASRIELPQPRIDKRVPETGCRQILPTRIVGIDSSSILSTLIGTEGEEIAPQELKPQPVRPLVGAIRLLVLGKIERDTSRREASPGEPERQLARGVPPEQVIARLLVGIGKPTVAILPPVSEPRACPTGRDQRHSRHVDRWAGRPFRQWGKPFGAGDRRGESRPCCLDPLTERGVGAWHGGWRERQIGIGDHAHRALVAIPHVGRGRLAEEEQIGPPHPQRLLEIGE